VDNYTLVVEKRPNSRAASRTRAIGYIQAYFAQWYAAQKKAHNVDDSKVARFSGVSVDTLRRGAAGETTPQDDKIELLIEYFAGLREFKQALDGGEAPLDEADPLMTELQRIEKKLGREVALRMLRTTEALGYVVSGPHAPPQTIRPEPQDPESQETPDPPEPPHTTKKKGRKR
jgi:hypothetical protein